VLTPDSSRFWPAEQWQPGRSQPSFDKQYVRDWLLSPEAGWDRESGQPPPPLPDRIVERTRGTYLQAYERITGLTWDDPAQRSGLAHRLPIEHDQLRYVSASLSSRGVS
jgi:phosphoribosylaminoimidazole-succinocarboxamide synthase